MIKMQNNLYLYLLQQDKNTDYDSYDSAVVCAASEASAKLTHPDGMRTWNPKGSEDANWGWLSDWAVPEHVTVKLIGTAQDSVEPGVICASFNAG